MIAAGFVAGLLGSAHCLGMCAGVSGLFAVNAGGKAANASLPMALTYNLGRLVSYAVLGTIVALFGSALVDVIPKLAAPVRLITGFLIILIGVQIAFNWRFLQPIETMGATIWQKISPLAQKLLPVTSAPRALGLGLLWGLLPCGLVYSMLLIAAATANPVNGALTMVAFGLGTTPAMVMTGVGAITLSRFMGRKRTRLVAGILIIAVGVLTLSMPVSKLFGDAPQNHQHHRM
jgi:sulfite exporter TauE/SafE